MAMTNLAASALCFKAEKYNQVPYPIGAVDWLPLLLALFVGCVPWILLFPHCGAEHAFIPACFSVPVLNLMLQHKRVGSWSDYEFGERAYIVLSLLCKAKLGWFVFASLAQSESGVG